MQEDLQSFCPITVVYNFECDWLIELSDNKFSDNKLSDNNLTGKLVENRSFFLNHTQSINMIKFGIVLFNIVV